MEGKFDSNLYSKLSWWYLMHLFPPQPPQGGSKLTAGLMDDLHLIPTPSFLLLLSPLPLLILSTHNTASPGQAWTGGWSWRPDPETKLSLPLECPPPGPLSSRKSVLYWDRALNKLLMRNQTSILCEHQDRWMRTTCLF